MKQDIFLHTQKHLLFAVQAPLREIKIFLQNMLNMSFCIFSAK